MIEVLYRWNRWGSNPLKSGILRKKTAELLPYLDTPETLVLVGPRRAGKSTILYQLMDALEKKDVPPQAMLHINFEEPRLVPLLNLKGLDDLYENYREQVFPEGKVFLFLDEIQNVPDWEKWVRARSQTEDIKIFITGSSAKLMSREIATLLTGRHLSFEVFPLDFAEYLEFQKIPCPQSHLPINALPIIRKALSDYQQWGGFPAVVLAATPEHKQKILTEYFDDILYKDIVLRHSLRDPILLRNMAVHLLTQTANLLSFQRIANIFQTSPEAATNYCRYLQESFMVELLPFFSLKAAVRQRHPHKVHAMDLGLRQAVSLSHSSDEGHLAEALVYHQLRRYFGDNVFYWKEEGEVDFLVREGNTITQIWQVVSEKLEEPDVLTRELKAIEEARKQFPQARPFLISKTMPERLPKLPCQVIPLWSFLLTKL